MVQKILAYPLLNSTGELMFGVRMLVVRDNKRVDIVTHKYNAYTNSLRTIINTFDSSYELEATEYAFKLEREAYRHSLKESKCTWQDMLTDYRRWLSLPNREIAHI